ncbi:hypothetical protein BFN67_22900 [Pseudaminobacter manganicus]|uniref:Sulfatase-modifying factor enzyme-like domain-containing protein n=2 Tax=Hyphomicrobiales TaxID=356 RepID=A0A1V8RLK0_9HYPH|nr:hypothetical protein BFN67_22900 [Pseudaminobacter manganicus]
MPGNHTASAPRAAIPGGSRTLHAGDTVLISGGTAFRGTDKPVYVVDGEAIVERAVLADFRIDKNPVSNRRFSQFVAETGYRTHAEEFGWSYVFHLDAPRASPIPNLTWWRRVDGANWRQPEGAGSGIKDRANHPVVHVSWRDAAAFAKWCGGRLPTEIEWEHAARAGQGDVRFTWGDREPDDTDFLPCNIWQGEFPAVNIAADGYFRTAPEGSFAPNPAGIHNMLGNVWEWTADPFKIRSLSRALRRQAETKRGMKVLKGGSFLCHLSYCYRYRIAARTGNTPDSSTSHQGFRLVCDMS